MIAAARSEVSVNEPVLYVAFELGKKEWKLAMTSGFGVAAVAADGRRAVISAAVDARDSQRPAAVGAAARRRA